MALQVASAGILSFRGNEEYVPERSFNAYAILPEFSMAEEHVIQLPSRMIASFAESRACAVRLVAYLLVSALSILAKAEAQAAPADVQHGELTFRIAERGNPILLPVEVGEGRYP